MYNFEQSKIVLVAVSSPSVAPVEEAKDDINTVEREDREGHPQSAPNVVWANDDVANANTAEAANAILVTNFFIGVINLVFKFPDTNVWTQQKIN